MTEYEKMVSGHLYNPNKEEKLKEMRAQAREIIYDYNLTRPSDDQKRIEYLKLLLGKTGANVYIEPPFHCDYGKLIEVGEDFYANFNLTILDCAPVKIGHNVMCAPNVSILTATHPIDPDIRNSEFEYALPITIGNNVWLGASCMILPGVIIGDNCVIGAGSVVTKSIPANSVAVGNPCRVIRQISEKDKQDANKLMFV
ncbi:sugar O-acetyltransferase [Proteus myxofaciens]|uniref:Acetyltransferase n=1 Tax=Proteus myxofaciens ATCC 19692 TaxID=1354337 RepID=A0A198GQU1_9GAMM|nr:sugar O-acetyltransferase [Proteus myxofaciens]OAT39235.1 galactoside O-acetyltransferase [Proteus myxofaciens ATCC 19692]